MSASSRAGRPAAAVQDVVDLGDELHVAVFDAVVHHLHVVPGALRSHVIDARLAVFGLGGDGAEDRRQRVPRLLRSARHDRRAEQRSFFAPGDPGADEAEAGAGEVVAAPIGVGEERIAAVDEDVAFVQMRTQVRDDAVHRLSCRHHHQHAARLLEHLHQLLGLVSAGDGLALRRSVQEALHLLPVEVVTDDGETLALDIPGEARSHHAEPDNAHLVFHSLLQNSAQSRSSAGHLPEALQEVRRFFGS